MSEDSTPSMKSRPLSRRLRFEILRRDGHTCRYCGAMAPDVPMTVDHVIPVTLGGSDDATNLVTACRDCNSGKSSTSPTSTTVADVSALALDMASALEEAADRRRAEAGDRSDLLAQFDTAWRVWHVGSDQSKHVYRPRDWALSVSRFLDNGFTISELSEYVTVTMNGPAVVDKKWAYLCGCCWRELTTRQELARQIVEDRRAAMSASAIPRDVGPYAHEYDEWSRY